MRIMFLFDFPIKGGGSGYYLKFLALRLLEKHKHEIAVVLPDKQTVDDRFRQYYIPVKNSPVFINRPGLEKSKTYKELAALEIEQLYHTYNEATIKAVQDFKPDVIHVHHVGVNAWSARFARALFNTKLIITSHGSCLYNISKDRRYYKLSKDALKSAQYITAVSGDNKSKLLRMFGEDLAPKVRTITGGIRISHFPSSIPKEVLNRIRVQYKIPDGPVILFSGRLISEKGIDYIIHAAKDIKGHILIAGEGIERKKYEAMVKENNITNVQLLGYVDHDTLVHMYYLADVFVSPSIWDDPMPLTIIEAMAAKCPLVVTEKGGIPLAVKDGYNGFFVRPRSTKDIVKKVNILLEDKELRRVMGERAREIVLKKFTWSHIAERFNTLYHSL